ncbi:MAG: hypothetical protein RIS70_2670 [Planctomycetota bacterium]
MPSTDSRKLEEALHVRLSPSLVAWFDAEAWQSGRGAEFSLPLSAGQIIDPEEGTIWSGFMLPDTLPLASNEYGDWLCVRIDNRGQVAEILMWSHVGGDWIPYGRDWPDALLFDAASEVLYHRRHEYYGEDTGPDQPRAWSEWAAAWLAKSGTRVAPFWNTATGSDRDIDPLAALHQAGICSAATAMASLLRHLDAELRSVLTLPLAQQLGFAWEPDAVSWLFDTRLAPGPAKETLCQRTRVPADELFDQDWTAAESIARHVLRTRCDLGWAFDIVGWSAERRGDFETAVDCYLGGIRPSLFADNTTRFRTHWFADGYGKFSAARLFELRDYLPDRLRQDPYLSLFLRNDNSTLRSNVRDYWLERAHAAEHAGDHPRAYACFYQAGWDMGLQDIDDFREIFRGLRDNASQAGWPALEAIAALHRRFLPT